MAGDDVTIKIGADTSEAQAGIEAVSKSSAGLGDSLKTAGLVAAGAFAAISTAIGVSVASYKEAEKVQAQLSATLLSTNFAAGLTSKELLGLATELQSVSIFSDEAIASSENLLLTFDKVGKEIFPRAQKSILDVASGLKVDLQSATQLVGKALNDPVEGLAALSRVGIRFTDVQKDLIRGFISVGDTAGAQDIVLQELEKRFKGQALAATDGLGAIDQLKNSFDDLLEVIGKQFAPILTSAAKSLKELIELAAQNEGLIRFGATLIGIIGGVAGIAATISGITTAVSAAIPVISSLNVILFGTASAIRTVIGATGFGLIILAIVGLVSNYDYWINRTQGAVFAVLGFFHELYTQLVPLVRSIGDIIAGVFTLDVDRIQAGLETDFAGIIPTFKAAGKRAREEYAAGKALGDAAIKASNDKLKADETKHAAEVEAILRASNERQLKDQIDKSVKEIVEHDKRSSELIAGEQAWADETIAIDRSLADEQVGTYEDGTERLIESSNRRRQAISSESGSGGGASSGGGQKLSPLIAPGVKSSGGNVIFDDSEEGQRARRAIGPNTYNPFTGRNDLKEFLVEAFRKSGVKFAEGYSGVGGENFAARFNGREIVIPENFAEGIRKGRFALTGADAGGRGGGSANVQISFQGREAARVLTARQTADRRLGTYRSRS